MNSTALREKIQRSGNLDKQTNAKNQIDEKTQLINESEKNICQSI